MPIKNRLQLLKFAARTIGFLCILYIASSLLFSAVEIYVFLKISQIIAGTFSEQDFWFVVSAIVLFFPAFIINRFIQYEIPKKLGSKVSALQFETLTETAKLQDMDAGILYSSIVDETKRFVYSVVSPLSIALQKMILIFCYIVYFVNIFGLGIFASLVFLVPIGIYFWVQKTYNGKYDGLINKTQSQRSLILQTLIRNRAEFLSFTKIDLVKEKFEFLSEIFFKAYRNGSILVEGQRLMFDLIIFGGAIFLLVVDHQLKSDLLVFTSIFVLRLFPQIIAIFNALGLVSMSMTSVDAVASTFGSGSHLGTKVNEVSIVDSISLSTANGLQVFKKGINVLVGPSGCGKTTILKKLLMDLRFGEIGASPSVKLVPKDAVVSIVYISDSPISFEEGGSYNLYSSITDAKKFENYCLELGLSSNSINKLLTQDTKLGFSHGENQRISIARALSTDANVLILDETLSGLDSLLADKLLNMLMEKNIIVILVTHEARLQENIAFRVIKL